VTRSMETLRRLFDELRGFSLELKRYRGQPELRDVAFDLTTADTFLAGVAATLLERAPVNEGHRRVAADVQLHGTSWRALDGVVTDLASHPELLAYARRLEQLRQACSAQLLDLRSMH